MSDADFLKYTCSLRFKVNQLYHLMTKLNSVEVDTFSSCFIINLKTKPSTLHFTIKIIWVHQVLTPLASCLDDSVIDAVATHEGSKK